MIAKKVIANGSPRIHVVNEVIQPANAVMSELTVAVIPEISGVGCVAPSNKTGNAKNIYTLLLLLKYLFNLIKILNNKCKYNSKIILVYQI